MLLIVDNCLSKVDQVLMAISLRFHGNDEDELNRYMARGFTHNIGDILKSSRVEYEHDRTCDTGVSQLKLGNVT